MNRYRFTMSWLLLIGLLIGCDSREAREPHSGDFEFRIDSSGGTVRAQNLGEPPRWRLEERIRISSDDLGRIVSVIADESGRVYLADELRNQIHVFDAQGEPVDRLGRAGSGPGEFGRLISVAWLGDTIAALDPGNGRLGLLARNGDWVGQRPYMAYAGVRLYSTGRDELYMPFIRIRGEAVEPVFVRQLRSEAADTVANPEDPRVNQLAVTCLYNGGEQGITRYRISDGPRHLRVPAPGIRLAELWTADYRIAFLTVEGDTARIVERDLGQLRWSNEDWRAEEAAFEEFASRYPGTTCEPRRLPRPEAKERIRTVFFDDAERMWVEWKDESGAHFLDVFDEDGRLLGTLESFERVPWLPPYVRDDRIYLVTAGELGDQSIRVFDLRQE